MLSISQEIHELIESYPEEPPFLECQNHVYQIKLLPESFSDLLS